MARKRMPSRSRLRRSTIKTTLLSNELLGINNESKISGYYGSGAYGHANGGYIVYPPYGQSSYRNENYPGATGTQVTSLNNTRRSYTDKHGRIFWIHPVQRAIV